MATIPGFFTVQEAARLIGVSSAQVNKYIRDGKLKARDLGKQWLIPQDAVNAFERPPRGNPTFRRKK